MAAAEKLLRSGEVSAMIKHGFLSPTYSPRPPTPTSSPPSSSPGAAHPSSPMPATLFEMISHEDSLSRPPPPPPPLSDSHHRLRALISSLASEVSPMWGPGDVDLTVSSREGLSVSMEVHRRVLAGRSRFFEEKLGGGGIGARVAVEICDCDDVEVYVEVVAMMYCQDLKKRLAVEEVGRVLEFLKVCVEFLFDAGVKSCLEFLEATPWSEDEEQTVVSVLRLLRLHDQETLVLQRVYAEPSTSTRADGVLVRLLSGVLQAKDEKARREMKALLARLLGEGIDQFDVTRETLFHLCHKCLNLLHLLLSEAANMDEGQRDRGALMGEIAREADNMQWLLEILISRKMADEFVTLWADQKELASLHSKIPCMYRFEISRITARLCVALGQGQVLVSGDARSSVLQTWLEALYEDYGWMRRTSRTFDKRTVEDGLSETILTLSMAQQQVILLRWFDHFLNKGDDCPNIQKAFKVWWRRAFIRHHVVPEEHSQLQIAVCNYPT